MAKLGIDLGSSSLGWSIREDNIIYKKGVVTFDSGMVKGQGGYSSPTKDRREARSKRRLIQARKYRKWELLNHLINNENVPLEIAELKRWSKYQKGIIRKFPENENFLKWLACDFTYLKDGEKYANPYELRVKALDSKISKHELGRVLYHLIQRRGYKDIGETDKETQTQIDRRDDSGLKNALEKHRTLGEALKKEFLDQNIRARNEYPFRKEYEDELIEIFSAQSYDISIKPNNEYKDTFINKVRKSIIWQRPLRSQKGNIGKCSLEPNKQRCPLSHPIFEVYRAWAFINTIKYFDNENKKVSLNSELRDKLFLNIFLKKDNFRFEEIRKYLDKQLQKKVVYNYPIDVKTGKYETSVSGMPVCKELNNLFGDVFEVALLKLERHTENNAPKIVRNYSIYDLWHALFTFDDDYLEGLAAKELGIGNIMVKRNKIEVEISPLVIIKKKLISGYSDLSLKAIRKIIPFLKKGFIYNEAVLLAKFPDLLGNKWDSLENEVIGVIERISEKYSFEKEVVKIANRLVEKHKGLEYPQNFAFMDYNYVLDESDEDDIYTACENYFGDKTWGFMDNKDEFLSKTGLLYQDYFADNKRSYRESPTLSNMIIEELGNRNITLSGELYHHSMKKNIYGVPVRYNKGGTEIDILPEPRIDSIKNPMFNKSMSILRRLINELIINGDIDNDTEIIIEVARELNDNNKRAAVERYQNERNAKREKYRVFLNEFKNKENSSINVEKSIPIFELWTEQIFNKEDLKADLKQLPTNDILKEKSVLTRYELWREQEGICMYTGNMISITKLFSNEIDIEHTIPRSILPDNTMANQTVCYASYNRDIKKNKIPFECDNFSENTSNGTSISLRLDAWKKIRDNYQFLYEKRLKPFGGEDEIKKNTRIQEKHYYRMHLDYWRDKINRFESQEIKDGWARRQLVDTQMVSKYAREFLRTYFKKVAVQKGQVTAVYRKMLGFQEEDKIKSRNKHTHHAIDATILTLIPVNSSKRDELIKDYFKTQEEGRKVKQFIPYKNFNSQDLIKEIESTTLIVNYEKDKITQQTKRKVRNRGKIQFVKNKNGEFLLNKEGERIQKIAQGDTIRSTLFKQTYLGKIKDVERDENGKPIRKDGDWKYKSGEDEFIYTERKPIEEVLKKTTDIVDPKIKKHIENQKGKAPITDFQGKKIRHVRMKVKAGKKVKERVNYRSKHEHKNYFYSSSGSIPYAIMLQSIQDGQVIKKLIPISSYQIANTYRKNRQFDLNDFINSEHPEFNRYEKKLLKVGQKVFVLQDDNDFEKIFDTDFQQNRLFKITQFKFDGSKIMLQYHLEAQSKSDIDKSIKNEKDKIIREYEKQLNIKVIEPDLNIENNNDRNKDFERRLYNFNERLRLIKSEKNDEFMRLVKEEIEKYKTESSTILVEGKTPILGLSQKNWNFLYENHDFNLDLTGSLNWNENMTEI